MSRLRTVKLSDVQIHPLSWLWPGRIARGKVTLLAGDPGLGKSFITTDITARVTRAGTEAGDWPDGPSPLRQPGDVIFLNAEDDPSDTICPRLTKAGADLRRVTFVSGVRRSGAAVDGHLALDQDVQAIAEAIRACERPRLVVIDPISAYMGQADSNSNAEVRGVLAELTRVAQATGVAVLCVTHLSKGSNASGPSRAVYRAMGSLAFTAAARMVWYVQALPDSPSERAMTLVKCNICPPTKGLAFRIDDGRVDWLDTALEITADDLEQSDAGQEACAVPEAADFLRTVLAEGPMSAAEVLQRAAAVGIAQSALERAKRRAGVNARHQSGGGPGGQWVWTLNAPTGAPADAIPFPL